MHTTRRNANILGALAAVLSDLLADATELAGGQTAATALVAIGGRAAGASIDALAGILGLSHSGTVRVIDRLVRDGLVERRRAADQRSVALILTPAGRRLGRRVLDRREANMQSVAVLLTDDQRAAAVEIAEVVVGALAANPGAEPRICRLCDLEACGRRRGTCPAFNL
jgi:MarR family transcriptional repressor of emrRAB